MSVSKETVGVGVTAAAVLTVVVYSQYKFNKLQAELDELKKETQTLAKYVKLLEAKMANEFKHLNVGHPTRAANNPPHVHQPVQPQIPTPAPTPPARETIVPRPEPSKPAPVIEDSDSDSSAEEEKPAPPPPQAKSRRRFAPKDEEEEASTEVKQSTMKPKSQRTPPNIPTSNRRQPPKTKQEKSIDDDLLGDIEAAAGPKTSTTEGRESSMPRNKERMARTKMIAAKLQQKREESGTSVEAG